MNIVLIGAGNLATWLGRALLRTEHNVCQVYSRTDESAIALSEQLHCVYTTSLQDLYADADLYVVAVKDHALSEVLDALSLSTTTRERIVHTAGSVPMDVFTAYKWQQYGVFYPLQTFSASRNVDSTAIPFFIEASTPELLEQLKTLACCLTTSVYELDSEHRKWLHLSAVFACNFTNHCYALAQQILSRSGMPFEVLLPLIDETAAKVHQLEPVKAQTGPAVRFDENILATQRDLLASGGFDLDALYVQMSESIHRLVQAYKKTDT